MNPTVSLRTSGLGHYAPTRAQRIEAAQEITANLRARLMALQSKGVAAQASASAMAKSSSAGAAKAEGTREVGGDTLDRDAFLLLLVQQMQNQDPMEPMDNADMLAQLAQFASLEQATNLNESFTGMNDRMDYLVGNMDQLNYISAQGLLGQEVAGVNAAGETVEGTVQGVGLTGSIVILTVNGERLPMSGVTRIGQAPTEPAEEGGEKRAR